VYIFCVVGHNGCFGRKAAQTSVIVSSISAVKIGQQSSHTYTSTAARVASERGLTVSRRSLAAVTKTSSCWKKQINVSILYVCWDTLVASVVPARLAPTLTWLVHCVVYSSKRSARQDRTTLLSRAAVAVVSQIQIGSSCFWLSLVAHSDVGVKPLGSLGNGLIS
jgi:hypothetical protein